MKKYYTKLKIPIQGLPPQPYPKFGERKPADEIALIIYNEIVDLLHAENTKINVIFSKKKKSAICTDYQTFKTPTNVPQRIISDEEMRMHLGRPPLKPMPATPLNVRTVLKNLKHI